MILIENVLVSRAVLEEEFVCNLNACKGACCVEGEEGATVTVEEIEKINSIYDKVKPYITEEGIKAIEENGIAYKKPSGAMGLNAIDNKACVFISYDENGIAKCGIEDAHRDGAIDWKKPLSCHLYPIRIDEYKDFEAVNYYEWDICSPACTLGKELKVPVYKFLKEPLVRKFGEYFWKEIDGVAQALNAQKEKDID